MEFLKEVSTKVFDPNVIPVGTCVRLTTRNNPSINALVCGYDRCGSVMMVVYAAKPPATDVKWVTINAQAVADGSTKIEPLISTYEIELKDVYSNDVFKVHNPMTVKQFKDHVNSIPDYLDNMHLIISKKSVDGTKLMHHYTEATDCIYYDDEDEKRMYGGLLMELC